MSHSYWPETNRLPDVSLANLGLFGISRELQGFPGGSVIKNLPANEGAVGSIPGLGRSSGAGNGNPIPALLPGESRRQSSLGGCRPRCYCSCRCCCSVTKSCRTLCNPGTAALQAGAYSNSSPLSQWCHPTISSSVIPFSSCLNLSQHLIGSFPMSQLFASALVLLMNIQGWFPVELTGLISLLSKGLLKVFSSTTIRKHQFFSTQPSLWSNSHIPIWLLEKS